MFNTKNLETTNKMAQITVEERKAKTSALREEHQAYFQTNGIPNALFIPKCAYRSSGKDELHVSFFKSELEKNENIYTEFVSIQQDSEDPKRTLYLIEYNPDWENKLEKRVSANGYETYLIPVSKLKVINDVITRRKQNFNYDFSNPDLPDPDKEEAPGLVEALVDINKTLKSIQLTLNSILNK